MAGKVNWQKILAAAAGFMTRLQLCLPKDLVSSSHCGFTNHWAMGLPLAFLEVNDKCQHLQFLTSSSSSSSLSQCCSGDCNVCDS